jgi:hypothetical protein
LSKKEPVTTEILTEWETVRRTAEFFDTMLGSLRALGLTATITMVGVAIQFEITAFYPALVLFCVGFFVVDRRYQSYLKIAAKYGMEIEKKYDFAGKGLTHLIFEESQTQGISRPEHVFQTFYVLAAISGIGMSLYIGIPILYEILLGFII